MGEVERTVRVDDLDGTPGAERISLSYRGVAYELDLAPANASALDAALRPFLDAARQAAKREADRKQSRAQRERSAAIREWARKQGIKVSKRGRIPAEVTARYDAEHGA